MIDFASSAFVIALRTRLNAPTDSVIVLFGLLLFMNLLLRSYIPQFSRHRAGSLIDICDLLCIICLRQQGIAASNLLTRRFAENL